MEKIISMSDVVGLQQQKSGVYVFAMTLTNRSVVDKLFFFRVQESFDELNSLDD